jgi:hypothetical protein
MRVFVTGGTGLVGQKLAKELIGRGDAPVILSRRPDAAKSLGLDCEVVTGDPTQSGPWQDHAASCDAVINLAGEPILGSRWSTAFKQKLRDSRVHGTANCVEALRRNPRRGDGTPKVLVNASAIGFYGPRGDEELTERSPVGNDFLSKLCTDWEKAAEPVTGAGVRLALMRIGIVLDTSGGALSKLIMPFKMFAGGPVASGKQWMSWIHIDDAVGLLLFALDQRGAEGPINVTAPNPVTNKQFGKALGKALHRPSFVWTPGFALKIMLGQGAEIITNGQRVMPAKAVQLGYRFKFPEIDAALANLLAK